MDDSMVKEVSLPVYQSKGWMKLIGIVFIVYGALAALTLVGIIFAWLPIWAGVLLIKSASAIEQAYINGEKNALLDSLMKLKTYFTIMGVTTLIGLAFVILGILFGVFGAILGMSGMQGMEGMQGM